MFLDKTELVEKFFIQVAHVKPEDIDLYLSRANAYCHGYIGGVPPTVDFGLKVAVAYAFEIFARGELAQIDEDTGNITDVAPSAYTRSQERQTDIFRTVKEMLHPYKLAFENATALTDRSVKFI